MEAVADRMGSASQMVVAVLAVAELRGWRVCAPPAPQAYTDWLALPRCAQRLAAAARPLPNVSLPEVAVRPGAYFANGYGCSGLWALVRSEERRRPYSVWTPALADRLARMVSAASPPGRAWHDELAVKVAVHVRRGDITPQFYAHAWIPDRVVVAQIGRVVSTLRSTTGRRVEVHVFSEAYGITNWTAFRNAGVHALHLAPGLGGEARRARDAVQRNLRDWAHFVEADVLIIGGTFSAVPALARRPPAAAPTRGGEGIALPATFFWAKGSAYFSGEAFRPPWWVPYD